MTIIKRILIIIFILILSSYSESRVNIIKLSLANTRVQINNCTNMFSKTTNLNSYYQNLQINTISSYFKNKDFTLAEKAINRFIYLYPTYSNMDYLIYMLGLINMKMNSSIWFSLFHIKPFDRDQHYLQLAFQNFVKLLHDYPNSIYANNTKIRLNTLRNYFAEYNLSVSKFYAKRKAYISVINRVNKILTNYSDTKAAKKALLLKEKVYNYLLKQS